MNARMARRSCVCLVFIFDYLFFVAHFSLTAVSSSCYTIDLSSIYVSVAAISFSFCCRDFVLQNSAVCLFNMLFSLHLCHTSLKMLVKVCIFAVIYLQVTCYSFVDAREIFSDALFLTFYFHIYSNYSLLIGVFPFS